MISEVVIEREVEANKWKLVDRWIAKRSLTVDLPERQVMLAGGDILEISQDKYQPMIGEDWNPWIPAPFSFFGDSWWAFINRFRQRFMCKVCLAEFKGRQGLEQYTQHYLDQHIRVRGAQFAPIHGRQIMTKEEFPHGLRCSVCSVEIKPGEPYSSSVPTGFIDDVPVFALTCLEHEGQAPEDEPEDRAFQDMQDKLEEHRRGEL